MIFYQRLISYALQFVLVMALAACGGNDNKTPNVSMTPNDDQEMMMSEDDITPTDPATAQRVVIDRFSAEAGNLFIRNESNGLPASNTAIDFDAAPFITQGLGPNGELVEYYNFDVMTVEPAPIYVLFHEGEDTPVAGQLNVIDVIPGEAGYNDFWQVHKVTVPADYVANTVTSYIHIMEQGFSIEATEILVNCPVVPVGSTAQKRLNNAGNNNLVEGWYQGMIVSYFSFGEKELMVEPENPVVPLSPIYVTFNINPDQAGGGPPSGFVSEEGSMQTHNVIATLPEDEAYSPLWLVNAYDNADFESVTNLSTAWETNILGAGVARVNCPVVSIQLKSIDPAMAIKASVDRFSGEAGTLFVRNESNSLPAHNAPIDFDVAPFITKGFGPSGELVEYYNFDVMPLEPAPIYVLFHDGDDSPVSGQLNIIDVIPGDTGYNDFWHVHKVIVSADYVANTMTSYAQIMEQGFNIEVTETLVNCPVVPAGSTAQKRFNDGESDLVEGWYQGMIVSYFTFGEKALTTSASNPTVPLSPIYVTFNINPGQPNGGPSSGFVAEEGSSQTHNVIATLPQDEAYSPLWLVNAYDNADFSSVSDFSTAITANILGAGVATVNCPVVAMQ